MAAGHAYHLSESGTEMTVAIAGSHAVQNRVDLSMVQKVVLVMSSSRGGSSAFAEWLRPKERLLSLDGELKPLLRQSGLDDPLSDSDHIADVDQEKIRLLRRLMVGALGAPAKFSAPLDGTGLIARSSRSISLQWPGVADQAQVREIIGENLIRAGWSRVEDFDASRLMLDIVKDLQKLDGKVCPFRYDLSPELIAEHFPNAVRPRGPLSTSAHEETPFVLPRLAAPVSAGDLEAGIIVIKDPSNAYRFRLIREIFPKADIRVIHLVRNPAAAINGLIDGWNHWNFFSRQLKGQLAIPGYSDKFPWGKDWWNFELPPGWRSFRTQPLGRVCAFQWGSTHRAILDNVPSTGDAYLRLKFEDFIDATEKGAAVRREIINWLGIPYKDRQLSPPPQVMVTQPPSRARWRHREREITDYVRFSKRFVNPGELGYGDDVDEWV